VKFSLYTQAVCLYLDINIMNDSNNNNSSNEQVMNIKGMKVRIDDPLYKVGEADDGSDFSAECYVVQVETPCGRRFSHKHGFPTSELCYTEDGHEAFTDEREEKRAQAERLADRIRSAGRINLDHWFEVQPVYGSQAYVGQGGDAAFLSQYD